MLWPKLPEVWFWVFTTICAGVGAYVGAYLKKKGENLATKEDIDELTCRTKVIESKIDDQVWDRQRQWELTRDAALRMLEAHSALEAATQRVIRLYSDFSRGVLVSGTNPAIQRWREERGAMINALRILQFTCWHMDTSFAAAEYLMALEWFEEESPDRLMDHITRAAFELERSFEKLRDAVRRELRLQEQEGMLRVPTPQSTGSSAAQGPAQPDQG